MQPHRSNSLDGAAAALTGQWGTHAWCVAMLAWHCHGVGLISLRRQGRA